ncbi:hypothetical protein EPR50_G00057780 [Perca flavescens]|uniref:MARVEL domain-containing protein n=1 Tax=Perca flavescens TaxID=8167 RepID=A0A484D9C0_PERFV|nr:hypothetical protein EPR50_G00057780 [Perca flavescens]
MSASTSITTEAGSVLVVTHVIPAPQGAATQNSAEKKHREQLLALGTVQIMIGLAIFLFELAMIPHTYTLGIYSGAFIWAPLFDILSGSLMMCAGTSMNKCRVNGGVGLSVVAAVASGVATPIYVLDVLNVTGYLFQRYHSNHPHYYYLHNYYNDSSVTRGVLCVLAVFSFLGFMVSICITVLGCKASPQSPDQPLIIMTNQSYEAASQKPETTPTQGTLPR